MATVRRAIVCSGGNAKIPLSMATLRHLRARHGSSIKATYGVSCGSMEANKLAEDLGHPGALDELEAMIRDVDGTDFYLRLNTRLDLGQKNVLKHRRAGVMTLDPLYDRLSNRHGETRGLHRGRIPADVRCEVGVVSLATKRYRSIRSTEATTDDAWAATVCASCGESPIMDWWPVVTKSQPVVDPCIDGGFVHVIPDVAGWQGYTDIDVIFHSTVDRTNTRPIDDVDDLLEVAGRAAEIWTDGVIVRDLARLQSYAAAGVKVTLYAPPIDPRNPFDASRATMIWRLETLGPLVLANGRVLDGKGGSSPA